MGDFTDSNGPVVNGVVVMSMYDAPKDSECHIYMGMQTPCPKHSLRKENY